MRSSRTPIRGIFSHSISVLGGNWTTATLAPQPGNQMAAQGSTNTIIIPRDGWYRFLADTQYSNSAGTAYYSYVQLNGANIITLTGNQNVVASAPTVGYSRLAWCKAGDRVIVSSYHNETGVPRQVLGVLTIEEIIQ